MAGFHNEAGGHRIQRIPPTERRGRIHTSNVTVSVLDAVQAVTDMSDEDLSISWFSGTGPGGQHRNKKQNSVRLVHIPTGITATAQGRSRSDNLRDATSAIERLLEEQVRGQGAAAQNAIRSEQIGLGMRADKRRTYRFRDDLVRDDLTGLSTSCKAFMRGRIDALWPRSHRP